MHDHKGVARALVEVKDLQVHFHLVEGVVRAVDGMSFEIHPGRTLGVIGESGSGKSVSAQSILGIVPSPPAKLVGGEILLNIEDQETGTVSSVDLTKLPKTGTEYRGIRGRDIGMIFQEPMTSFSPVHTIGNQIMESLLLHTDLDKKGARERAAALLGHVGIPNPHRNVDAYPHEFSGGMRQRAMIAMALACQPRLLIADEPTTALDVTIEAQILNLIQELQQELHMAILYISHDLAVVGGFADEIMVMYMGMVMEYASADDIFDDPKHPYTQALWRSIPRIDGPLEALVPITGNVPSPFAIQRGCPFYSRCPQRIAGVCDESRPPEIEVGPNHTARCFLYTEDHQAESGVATTNAADRNQSLADEGGPERP